MNPQDFLRQIIEDTNDAYRRQLETVLAQESVELCEVVQLQIEKWEQEREQQEGSR